MIEVKTVTKEQVQEVFTPSISITPKRELTCKERIKGEYRKECEKLTWLFAVMNNEATQEQKESFFDYHGYDVPDTKEKCSNTAMSILFEYGLDISYVLPDDGRSKGYLQWLISWGGPSDEWRFYFVPDERSPYRIEYIFMDWYDFAKVTCTKGRVANLLWDWLYMQDTPITEYEKAKKEFDQY